MMVATTVLMTTYLTRNDMAENGVWRGDVEMCILAHMLDAPIYSYQADSNYWLGCFPHAIDRRLSQNVNVHSLYIFLRSNHFQVVTAVRRIQHPENTFKVQYIPCT